MRAGGLGLQAGKVLGASQQRRTCTIFFFFFFYYLWRSLLRNDDKISCSRTVRSLLSSPRMRAPDQPIERAASWLSGTPTSAT